MPDLRASAFPAAAAGLVALTGAAIWFLFFSPGASAVAVAPPTPSSGAAKACADLSRRLPGTVDGRSRRRASPSSPLTAAWGDPAITLRCGVPEPQILRPGSKDYNPQADVVYANGVAWLIEPTADGYRFTAIQRAVLIEVDVPAAYLPETDALPDLANAVIAGVPRSDGGSGPDTAPMNGDPTATATASPSSSAG
jgi:Protein of unknown function (DUF3515)